MPKKIAVLTPEGRTTGAWGSDSAAPLTSGLAAGAGDADSDLYTTADHQDEHALRILGRLGFTAARRESAPDKTATTVPPGG